MIGSKLAHYEITGHLGSGGMGDVYQATDTKLGRSVAIKILPEVFARDADRLARFEREARVLASLNHPNIAAIYGLEQSAAHNFLVMEFVGGETLSERIKRGPIPVDESLAIAKQIAAALEAAHESGVIHRDLKPPNIKITPDGKVKVLDFGLAKAMENTTPSAVHSNSPTLSLATTNAGVILGTAAYMSPEQARGKVVDKRTDIWAFGVVLYEMLTGERLFQGEDVTETLAAVIRKEPEWERISPEVRRLLKACLERDPKLRLHDISDASLLLEAAPGIPAPALTAQPPRKPWVWIGATAVCLGAALVFAFVHLRETPLLQATGRFQVIPPGETGGADFKVSPDGRYLAIVASEGGHSWLWVRPIDSLQTQVLPGIEDPTFPFWSPDSAFIAFFAQGKLKKIALRGGPPQTLCDAPSGRGGDWNSDGVILFAPDVSSGLYRVAASGGVPVTVTKVATTGASHRFPEFLPDGRRFLYLCHLCDKPEVESVYVGSLDGAAPVQTVPGDSPASYVPASASGGIGFLLFRRENTLMAQPFDPERLQPAGEMFPLAEQVGTIGGIQGSAAFSVSENGVLAYRSGAAGGGKRELIWMNRAGKRLGALSNPADITFSAALSPDENRVAFSISDPQGNNEDIWIEDLARKTLSRFTFNPGLNRNPVWSPDGGRIIYYVRGAPSAPIAFYLKPSSGASKQELLLKSRINSIPYDWSRDGKFIVYSETGERTTEDLWLLPLESDRQPLPYLQTPSSETMGQFSPDGRWMAYASDESRTLEVYVQPIPPTGAKWQISTAGGTQPRWRRDGKELFYIAADQKLMAVPVKMGSSFEPGAPQPLFEGVTFSIGTNRQFFYQPSADGQRFMVNVPAGGEAAAATPITVVLNWQTELRR